MNNSMLPPVFFNDDCYPWLYETVRKEHYSKAFVLVDSNTSEYCLSIFFQQLHTDVPLEVIELEPGEEHKNIETCIQVWQTLADLGADRKSLIINLGGGVITDLGGFVASTFKRGVDFINIPTTLLAMVDASLGGKTGVDMGALKNQIGVINNPVAVLIDTIFLKTLSPEQIRSGFAEMLKHGLIYNKEYWCSVVALINLTNDDLDTAIKQSVEIKNIIVKQDPTEKGIRKILNFGHTLGHAIESYFLESKNRNTLLHGEAIAIGMILESHISMQQGLLKEKDYQKIKKVLLSVYDKISFTEKEVDAITELLIHDKKSEFGLPKFVLLTEKGKAVIDKSVDKYLIYSAFLDYEK